MCLQHGFLGGKRFYRRRAQCLSLSRRVSSLLAASAFLRWRLSSEVSFLFVCLKHPVRSKGSVSSHIPQPRSALWPTLFAARGEWSYNGVHHILSAKFQLWKLMLCNLNRFMTPIYQLLTVHCVLLQIYCHLSKTAGLHYGVPQGSVSGPIIFFFF